MRPPHPTTVAFVIVAVVGAACGGGAASRSAAGDGSGRAASVELSLVARDIAFQPAELAIQPGDALIIAFDNTDPGVPHGLVLYADPDQTIRLASAPIVVGPDHARFEIAPLVPGRYRFSCAVHPIMAAALVVAPG